MAQLPPQITIHQLLNKISEAIIVSPMVQEGSINTTQKLLRDGKISTVQEKEQKSPEERIFLWDDLKKANPEEKSLHDVLQEVVDMVNTTDWGTHTFVWDHWDSYFEDTGEYIPASHLINHHIDIEVIAGDDNSVGSIILTLIGLNVDGTAGDVLMAWDLTDHLYSVDTDEDGNETIVNPLNISQFIDFQKQKQNIDPTLANEYLDSTIYELLPESIQRQKRINAFFAEFQELTKDPPIFTFDQETGMVDDYFIDSGSIQYSQQNDISTAQNENRDDSEGMITRLDVNANEKNQGKTLQSLRDLLNTYLLDLESRYQDPEDQRPEYQNQNTGYLKFRLPNQGILIRNSQGGPINSLDPNDPTWKSSGFTITMWVRFLDKVSEGTLFNYGNPLRNVNPYGFTLDTFVLHKKAEDNISMPLNGWDANIGPDNPNGELFLDDEHERFLRLTVLGPEDILYSSYLGQAHYHKKSGIPMFGWDNWNYSTGEWGRDLAPNQSNVTEAQGGDGQFRNSVGLANYLKVPYDATEWYFIVATYDPDIDEAYAYDGVEDGCNVNPYMRNVCSQEPEFWLGKVDNQNNAFSHYSGYGNKCKVEIISRSDLLRARGYKV